MKITIARKCACVMSLLAFATAATAQTGKRFAAFAGYSSQADVTFAPVSSIPISLPGLSLNGWNGSLEFKFLRLLGVIGDVSGHYGSYGSLIRPSWRRQIFWKEERSTPQNWFWYFINRFQNGLRSFLVFYAIRLTRPALVDAFTNLGYVIILAGSYAFTVLRPRWLHEDVSGPFGSAKV